MVTTLPQTLANLAPTRRSILLLLKKAGSARAEELAGSLGLTVSALRQHLSALAADGLVGHEQVRSGPGRPKHLFHLTPAAEGYFPKFHAELTNELLAYVEAEDPELLDRLFTRRRQRRIEGARERLAGRDLRARVEELTAILDGDGYLADWVEVGEGRYRIVEHNCAILGVAMRYGQACSSELDFIRAVLPDAEVERVSHIVHGARMCAYEVRAA
ncbi:MAG TPA: ArsR family transcriptional regulator [Acidimicrobiales bacterium]